jgi:hypothetical protein
MPRSAAQWVALAQTRVLRILKSRVAATIRQLEVKISEAGPPDLRPEPHHLTTALTILSKGPKPLVRAIKPKYEKKDDNARFYTLTETDTPVAQARIEQLLAPYRIHRDLIKYPDYCSLVLEDIVRASFDATGPYKFLGKIPKAGPLDAAYTLRDITLGVEVKNQREWVYPTSAELWVMIRKCLELDALPVLITRKTAYITRLLCNRVGIFTYQVHRQYFAELTEPYLGPIRHKDQLGYKDIVTAPIQPLPTLVAYLSRMLPASVAPYRERWEQYKDTLRFFAIDRKMGDNDTKDDQRHAQYPKLWVSIFPRAEEDDEEGPPYDTWGYEDYDDL